MLVDRPGWAFDAAAQAFVKHLSDEFEFKVKYVIQRPDLAEWPFDLIYIFYWGETYYKKFMIDSRRIIKEVASHRWAIDEQFDLLSPQQMTQKFLRDAGTVVAISQRLQKILSPYREILWAPNGFEPDRFFNKNQRQGELIIGWAGNLTDPCKGVNEILLPAAGNDFNLQIAGGDMNYLDMSQFYNSIDVFCVSSTAEGEPLTLLEAMACGCYPVCVDVGIVPELIQSNRNGLIINRSIAAFRAAFQFCYMNIEMIRNFGEKNSTRIYNQRRWERTEKKWRDVFRHALKKIPNTTATINLSTNKVYSKMDLIWQQNLGDSLLEWSDRTNQANQLIMKLPLKQGDSIADIGCGKQTLRKLIPNEIRYIPIDKILRSQDTVLLDLNQSTPNQQYTVTVMLGILEYLDHPEILLKWCINNSSYLVFSFNDCSDSQRSARQHWKSNWSLEEVQQRVKTMGGFIQQTIDLGSKESLFLVIGRKSKKRLALFSASIKGDNSGDAVIVDAIKRLLSGNEMLEFPLLQPLRKNQIRQINTCDIGIICGTNLYQQIFACDLTSEVINQIKIPIVPLGVGSSAPIGLIPQMNTEGIRIVKLLHERCHVSSVRDPLSYKFIRNLGIRNVRLTGCPVLFHAITEPVFEQHFNPNAKICLSVRARLLHVEEKWNEKAIQTLELISQQFNPVIILQSPYDIPIAQALSQKYKLNYVLDKKNSHEVLIENVKSASRTVGFRLHFGMLGLSYGKQATLIATDTRVSSFCEMMGINYHDIRFYKNQDIITELLSPLPDMSNFLNVWRDLRSSMSSVLDDNGINHIL